MLGSSSIMLHQQPVIERIKEEAMAWCLTGAKFLSNVMPGDWTPHYVLWGIGVAHRKYEHQ
jgi:hypothetical protein